MDEVEYQELGSEHRPVFTVRGLLTAQECESLIGAAERGGFRAAPITTPRGFVMAPGVRNNVRYMVDDHARADWLWDRLGPWVPGTLSGMRAVGLNERLRFYRYNAGHYFRWHSDGYFRRDAHERSLLTVLVYLSGGLRGGATEFGGGLEVQPEPGLALVFAHAIHHQGAPVKAGTKYVLRTDVMYRRDAAAAS